MWPHYSKTARPRRSAAAARALERAAELSPAERNKARRLLAAADLALPAGQADWVRELAGKVLTLTSDPDLRIAARLDIGWSLLWSNRHADALETLIRVAAEASPKRPALAWEATGMAATVAHQTGLDGPDPGDLTGPVGQPGGRRQRHGQRGRGGGPVDPGGNRAARAAGRPATASAPAADRQPLPVVPGGRYRACDPVTAQPGYCHAETCVAYSVSSSNGTAILNG